MTSACEPDAARILPERAAVLWRSAPNERFFAIAGHRMAARPLAPGLHVVATPIGNLGDISIRALETLAAADAIACEDTRVTAVLLRHYGIETPLVAYHDHNAARQRPKLLAALAEGKAHRAGQRRRHAADLRSRLQAGRRGARRRPCRRAGARRLGAARRPRRRGAAHRRVPLRRLPAAEIRRPPDAPAASSRRCRRRWSSTRPARGSPPRSPTWPRCCPATAPAAVARELTKAFETVRAGTLAGAGREPMPRQDPPQRRDRRPGRAAGGSSAVGRGCRPAARRSAQGQAAQRRRRRGGGPHRPQAPRPLPAGARPEGPRWRPPDGAAAAGPSAAAAAPRRSPPGSSASRATASSPAATACRSARSTSIARRGRLIAFVEVKQRPSLAEAAEAVTPAARRRIARAASAWLAAHPAAAALDLRFDVIICVPGRLPRHIRHAFDAEGAA